MTTSANEILSSLMAPDGEISEDKIHDQQDDTRQIMFEMLEQEITQLLQDNARLTAQNSTHLDRIAQLQENSQSQVTPAQEQVNALQTTIQTMEERITSLLDDKRKLQDTVDILNQKLIEKNNQEEESNQPKKNSAPPSRWLGRLMSKRAVNESTSTTKLDTSTSDDTEVSDSEDHTEGTVEEEEEGPTVAAAPAAPPKSQSEMLAVAVSLKNAENARFGRRLSGLFSPKGKGAGPAPRDRAVVEDPNDENKKADANALLLSPPTSIKLRLSSMLQSGRGCRQEESSADDAEQEGKEAKEFDDTTVVQVPLTEQGKLIQAAIRKNKVQRKKGKLVII